MCSGTLKYPGLLFQFSIPTAAEAALATFALSASGHRTINNLANCGRSRFSGDPVRDAAERPTHRSRRSSTTNSLQVGGVRLIPDLGSPITV